MFLPELQKVPPPPQLPILRLLMHKAPSFKDHEADTAFMKEFQQNGTQESLITYITIKYRQKVCRRTMSEILPGIKMLSVRSFCSVVIVEPNLFRVWLRPRSHTEVHPTLWFANVNFLVLQ